jgi:predicted NBD/HSP70 family sugar kinase
MEKMRKKNTRKHPPGANPERNRQHNRRMVLGHVHAAGKIGRAEIARASGLSTQAVSNIIADLQADDILHEKGRLASGRGLPAVQYAVNPEGGYALGIEIRPNALFAAMLNLSGETVFTHRIALDDARPEAVNQHLQDLAQDLGKRVPTDRLLGAGVVMPGPFGQTGLTGTAAELPDWEHINIQDMFSNTLGTEVIVENDANAAAIAESLNGAGKRIKNFAYLYFGTGIGLGIVSQGKLLAGAFGNAGEIGKVWISTEGGPRKLEDMASRLSLHQVLELEETSVPDVDAIAQLHADKNPTVQSWINGASDAIAQVALIIENILDPGTIILGGALPSGLIDDLIAQTSLSDASIANRPDRTQPRLQRGKCGRLTATSGAAALILNQTFSPDLLSHA